MSLKIFPPSYYSVPFKNLDRQQYKRGNGYLDLNVLVLKMIRLGLQNSDFSYNIGKLKIFYPTFNDLFYKTGKTFKIYTSIQCAIYDKLGRVVLKRFLYNYNELYIRIIYVHIKFSTRFTI